MPRPSWTDRARKRWPEAETITGDGPWAALDCNERVITLHDTIADAERRMRSLDYFRCGDQCCRRHQVVPVKPGPDAIRRARAERRRNAA